MTTNEILISLLRSQICGTELAPDIAAGIGEETLSEIYKLSKPQDVTHIVASALLSANLVPDGNAKNAFLKEEMTAVFRHAQIRHELERISRAFEAAGVDFMPLKGSVIRKYYPRPEQRTSCDIDILVRPEDFDAASSVMENELAMRFDARTAHDASYYSASKTHIELHYDLLENNDPSIRAVLDRVWDCSHPISEGSHCFEMESDMFVAYHIIHMAKHFLGGGCGVRPFIDLWIAKNKMGYDTDNLLNILSECSLEKFARSVILLSDVWFSGEAHTDLTREIENYLLSSAIYGTIDNHVAIERHREGGKRGYYFKRLFMPYASLKKIYPRLEKYPVLYPFYQVKRWFRFILRGRLFHARAEIKALKGAPTDEQKRIIALCDELELK